ncbi:Hsp70 family protein [Schnuerera ultunensis]|nr:Hsp70 family protein [Schnuerera ultunensis]
MVYQTEKTLKDLEGKISDSEKSKVEEKLNELKKALEGDNIEEIKKKTEELTQEFYNISQKMYGQAQGQGTEPGTADHTAEDDVVDADYEVMDDDE